MIGSVLVKTLKDANDRNSVQTSLCQKEDFLDVSLWKAQGYGYQSIQLVSEAKGATTGLGFLFNLSVLLFFYVNYILRQAPLVETILLLTISDLHSHKWIMVERSTKNFNTDSHWSKANQMLIPNPTTVFLFGKAWIVCLPLSE